MKILILLFLLPLWLLAGIGNIAALKGNAVIKRTSGMITAVTGMEIEQKDEIITQDKTRVQVILKDQTVVTIGANSTFSFLEFSMQKGNEKISMQAKRGFFRSVTGNIGKIAPQRFKVHTVSATIGIRGTDFSALVQKDFEIIKCYKGLIRVTYSGGYRDIPVGNMIQISPKGVNTKPIGEKVSQKSSKKVSLKSKSIESHKSQQTTKSDFDNVHVDDVAKTVEIQKTIAEPFTITPQTNDRPIVY